MLDLGIGAAELMLIAAVALIVVGPKDLPLLMRRIGQFTARMRAMAAEFRSSFDEMARQSELDELRKEVEALRRGEVLNEAGGKVEMEQVFQEIDEGLKGGETSPYPGVEYAEPASLPPVEPESPAAEPAKPKRRPRTAKPKQGELVAEANPKRAARPRAKKAGGA
jgi:sec-independent protein translocase protein TatB